MARDSGVRNNSDDDEQPATAASRRRGRTANPRAEALERLKALRSKGVRRSESSYKVKYEEPIYDEVDDDKYKALVAERRDEFGDFIVDDEDGSGGAKNLGYRDLGEEEDWTRSEYMDWSDESDGGETGEGAKKKKKQQAAREGKEKKDSATRKPSAALTAAAALMGKQRIPNMFTSSVSKKKIDDGKGSKGALALDSIVDDLIAECAPDQRDREKRRRERMGSSGLVSSCVPVRTEKSEPYCARLVGRGVSCAKAEALDENLMHFESNNEDTQVMAVEDSADHGNAMGSVEGNDGSAKFEHSSMNLESCGEEMRSERKTIVVKEEVKVDESSPMEEVEPDMSKPEEKVVKTFSLNAKVKEEKIQTFSASAEMQSARVVNGTNDGSTGLDSDEKLEFDLESDGSLPFYIIDAHEETYGVNMGTIYLFGKVKTGNTYQSCCVLVKNLQRCVYAVPSDNVFLDEEVMKFEKEAAESNISPGAFRTKLHDLASGLKSELSQHLLGLNVSSFSMAPVKRSYAFERTDIPRGEYYVLKINYPFKDPPLPSDLKGENFSAVLGTNSSALELFLVKRKIKGPTWLSISKFSNCSPHQRVSWCKFEVTVDCSKDIQVSTSSKIVDNIPPVIVTAINLKTIINEKNNINEVISASLICCKRAKIDSPMLAAEWTKSDVLSSFNVVRKLEGGIFPMGFAKEVSDRNSKRSNVKLAYESSERALLNHLMIELYKLDSDVLLGHNISGFDLDILLHRAQACRVPSTMWSKIGRLKRSAMPKLTKESSVFGSGASSGIMTCIAGRLLCDTFLCSRDLLKEVSYSLTHLSKTQLNKDRKEIGPNDIPRMLQSTDSLIELMDCNNTDAWLSMELMFHLSILPLTRQLTNISGNLWGKTLQGARAQRVEYLLLHSFHAKKYILPDKYSSRAKDTKLAQKRKVDSRGKDGEVEDPSPENEGQQDVQQGKGKKGSSYAGGLVLEPKKGLYDKIILLLDFNSLYPSIIQEYNICFTTVERSTDGLAPRLPSCEKTGVLPELLKFLVDRRRAAKSLLKKASGLKACQYDIQQQALKLTANSMYGCLGFSNSRFYAKPLAELITSQGREILQSTVDLVQNNLNLEVIYGDTDSIMIYSGLDDVAEATAIAGKVIREVNKKYKCLEIDLDGLYKRMLLLKKKKYAAVKVQTKDSMSFEVIERKGLDMVRRDWSLLSKEMGDFCLSQILSGGSCEDVVGSIHNYLVKIKEEMRNGEVALEKYVITKTLTKPPEAYPDAKNQPHVQVALRLKQSGYSSGCSAGDTVPYIICCEEGGGSGTSTGMAQRARHPDELKGDNGKWMIDIDYYLSQQLHPVVSRLCACIQGTSPAHLADCLGLDPTKFRSKTTGDVKSDSSISLLFSTDEDQRYQGCEPLTLCCPSCSGSFECPSVFSSLCKSIGSMNLEGASAADSSISFWQTLRCPKCPTGEDDAHIISPAMIANQVKRQADHFISMYYKGTMICDDETCKYTTRCINLRVVGDSERGTICPKYPRCTGSLVKEYSAADLYRQLSYFCHLLDCVRCIDKVDVKARMAIEKEVVRVRPVVDLAAGTIQKIRDDCAYGWVNLKDLFP